MPDKIKKVIKTIYLAEEDVNYIDSLSIKDGEKSKSSNKILGEIVHEWVINQKAKSPQ